MANEHSSPASPDRMALILQNFCLKKAMKFTVLSDARRRLIPTESTIYTRTHTRPADISRFTMAT